MRHFIRGTHRFRPGALAVLLLVSWGCADQQSKTDIAASTNTAPMITTITAAPSTVTRGGTSHITVSAADAEGDQLSYSYSATAGIFSTDGNSATWTAPLVPGKYVLTVTISDGRASSEAWVALTVFVPLTTVTGTLIIPADQTGDLAGVRVYLRAGATSAALDTLVREIPATGSGKQASFALDDIQPGSYYLEAWRDSDHSGHISTGDLYGCYGGAGHPGSTLPPLILAEGETRFVRILMALVTVLPEDGTSTDQGNNNGNKGKGEASVGTEGYVDK